MRLFAGIVLASVVACSSSSSSSSNDGGMNPDDGGTSSDGGDPGAAFKTACAAYGKAICAREWACGSGTSTGYDAFRLSAIPAESQEQCAESTADACVAQHVQKGVVETAQDIEACAQKTTTLCTDVPPKCSKKGTLADGAACALAIQCAGGVCGREITGLDAKPCGKCASPKSGDGCASQYDCQGAENNLYCFNASTCDTLKKENDTCANKTWTEIGLLCSNTVVVKGPSAGMPCLNGECGYGLVCDMTDKCVARQFVGLGMACMNGVTCTPELTCNAMKCEPGTFGAEGASCGSSQPSCKSGLTCDPSYVCKKAVYVPTCN